jgi:predicted Zn-dependent peptidase
MLSRVSSLPASLILPQPDLRTRTLSNGLRIASIRLPGFRTASVGAWLRVGSRDEPAPLNGLSHFFEHMAFKGTESRSARDITFALERVGGSINAYTAKDHTAYEAQLLAAHADTALEVLADVLRRSVFPPEEIERERQVILQELGEAADDPDSLVQDAFDTQAFARQSLGRPILGSRRFVRQVTRDDFLAHQQSHYIAANLVVAGAGDIDHDRFADQVERHFGDMPTSALPPARKPARYVGGQRHIEDDYEQTSVAIGWPAPASTDPDFPAYELLGELLGGGMSSPLFQAVREQRGLAYQVDAWTEGHEDCGLLQLSAGVSRRNLRPFIEVAADEIARLAQSVQPEDFERARNQLATQVARNLERPGVLAESIARDLLFEGRVILPQGRLDALMAVDTDDLQRAAARMLSQVPTLAMVGRSGRGDPYQLLRQRLGS